MSQLSVYEGPITEQMPKLLSDGNVPASLERIAQAYLDKSLDITKGYSSGVFALIHPDDRIKIIYGNRDLWNMVHEHAPMRDDHMLISQRVFEATDALLQIKGTNRMLYELGIAIDKGDTDPFFTAIFRDADTRQAHIARVSQEHPPTRTLSLSLPQPTNQPIAVLLEFAIGGKGIHGASANLNFPLVGVPAHEVFGEDVSGTPVIAPNQVDESARRVLDQSRAFRYNGTLYVPTAPGIELK